MPQRGFSSGCIRIEKPTELALYVLKEDSKWTQETLLESIEKNERQVVLLPRAIPVHLLYWTAWTDGDGRMHFRRDIYGRDGPLNKALQERPPGP
jgi:murein L,D-transpeptidase YcbB/YkuD